MSCYTCTFLGPATQSSSSIPWLEASSSLQIHVLSSHPISILKYHPVFRIQFGYKCPLPMITRLNPNQQDDYFSSSLRYQAQRPRTPPGLPEVAPSKGHPPIPGPSIPTLTTSTPPLNNVPSPSSLFASLLHLIQAHLLILDCLFSCL